MTRSNKSTKSNSILGQITSKFGLAQRIPSSKPSAKFTLVSPMRNEGHNILEWLAWHRAVGFDEIVVVTNNCTDGSDVLLDHLSARGLVTHLDHDSPHGKFALNAAFEVARAHKGVSTSDWVMILDADEFLVVHRGDGTIQGLIEENGQDCLGMAIHWKCFGDNGRQKWDDTFVRQSFTQCAEGDDPANMRFKSIFRDAPKWRGFRSHAPFGYPEEWGGQNKWVDSSGKPLNAIRLVGDTIKRATKRARITHAAAQVNHYVTKSGESLLERRQKWERANRDARYDDEFAALYNKNYSEDRSALKPNPRFDAEYAKLIADSETLRLHHACCAAYVTTLVKLQGGVVEEDSRYLRHLELCKTVR